MVIVSKHLFHISILLRNYSFGEVGKVGQINYFVNKYNIFDWNSFVFSL
jgi:hypothetical protein